MHNNARTYLDYNATAPLLPCARDALVDALEVVGNASSVHFEGRDARKSVEASRRALAELIDANPANVIFTSGATEAANHALAPVIRAGGQELAISGLYVLETEHPCILSGGRFSAENIVKLPVNRDGIIDFEALTKALEAHDYAAGNPMVAVQLANNETGVIQPVPEIAEIVHRHEGFLLVDAVQALGKIPVSAPDLQADFLLLSSHKIGGPMGAGALVLANGNVSPIPLLKGGGQENYHRGGTENVAAIAGFGAACDWHRENLTKNIKKSAIRDSIEAGLRTISQDTGRPLEFYGMSAERLGNTTCFSFSGVKAETALVALDLAGISVSSGSACSSGKVKQSHVLAAMGASAEDMSGALRVSSGWDSSEDDAERFLNAWRLIVGRMAA